MKKMFEMAVSGAACYDIDSLILNFRRETELCGGLFAFENNDNRFMACMAISEKLRDYFLARIKEEICEHIAVEYKYDFFLKSLNLTSISDLEKVAFCSALAVFDKETDKKYISEHLLVGSEIVVDSAVAFCMPKLFDRWAEIVELVESNKYELSSCNGLVEMMRFLLKSSPCESEKIHIQKNNDHLFISNDLGKVQFEYYDDEDANAKVLHRAISLLPRQIALHGDRFDYLRSLFPNAKKQEVETIG